MAINSAFNALINTGVDGLKGVQPIRSEKKADYDYRFFSEERYVNYIVGQPKTLETKKIGSKQRATVVVSINLRGFRAELQSTKQVISPSWADAKQTEATSALNPPIAVVPYTDSNDGYSFQAMPR